MHPARGFATLRKDGVRLFLDRPGARGAGQSAAGDSLPPRLNRIQIEVEDLARTAKDLKHGGCAFKGEIVLGRGGKRLLLLDPSGNLVELFSP